MTYITKLIQSAYAVKSNTVSSYTTTLLSNAGVNWVLSDLGRQSETEAVLASAKKMAEGTLHDAVAMNRHALELWLSKPRQEIITEKWIVEYTQLTYGNIIDWDLGDDGVLTVTVHCLDRDNYLPDFMITWSRAAYARTDGDFHQDATINFCLPLPEYITPDGKADFDALCDKTAGPHDPVIYWHERIDKLKRRR